MDWVQEYSRGHAIMKMSEKLFVFFFLVFFSTEIKGDVHPARPVLYPLLETELLNSRRPKNRDGIPKRIAGVMIPTV